MTSNFMGLWRRRALLAAAGSALVASALAQPGRTTPGARPITIGQIFDSSITQQDVSKDFLIGSRAAWQDINLQGGVRGRPVVHRSIEVDGTPASVGAAVDAIRDNAEYVALSGTAGDLVATRLVPLLRQDNLAIAHVAPWLQNASIDIDDHTFPIFASRQEQISHALQSLSVMGVQEVGAIYASEQEHSLYREDLNRLAAERKVKIQVFHSQGDLVRLGQGLTARTPAILLFLGGTPELAQFTQGLERQARQRYVIAMADVNLQTLMQMGAARNTPIIGTQAVPMVNASLPVVRSYRETLARLFDEPPTPLSLAGFIAARYTFEVLRDVAGDLNRQTALAAFRRRSNMDVGGFRIAFDRSRRSGTFVTQSMLTLDGRVVG
jgi:ABC-type branched-subunit amino acid transport system substrate-binding protein